MLVWFFLKDVECRWFGRDGPTWRSPTDGHKFFGVRDPQQRNGHISLCATRQPRRCLANRNPGDVGGTESLSHNSNTAAQVLQSALALGPEDGNTRVGIEAAVKRVKDQTPAATQAKRALVPEAMFEAARVRVSKLEAAIEAMGEFQSPEVQFLQSSLARARVAVFPPPVDVQLTQCQQFIDRAN